MLGADVLFEAGGYKAGCGGMKREEHVGVVFMLLPSIIQIRVAHTGTNHGLEENELLYMGQRMKSLCLKTKQSEVTNSNA